MKQAPIAVGINIEFEGFKLHTLSSRLINDVDRAEIGKSALGAKSRPFRTRKVNFVASALLRVLKAIQSGVGGRVKFELIHVCFLLQAPQKEQVFRRDPKSGMLYNLNTYSMSLLRPINAAFDLLIEESSPSKLSGGIVLGMLLGLTPFPTLQWLFYLCLFFVLSVNLGTAIASYLFFSIVGLCLDPLFHPLGWWILTGVPALQKPFAWSYHALLLPYTRFSNTVVLGSFIVSMVLCLPLYFISQSVIRKHGPRIWYRIKQSLIGRVWLTSSVYRNYATKKSQ